MIHVVGDLSPSKEWCAFDFVPTDSQNLRKNLRNIDVLPIPLRRVPNPHVEWSPPTLNGSFDVARVRRDGFESYIVERPETAATQQVLLFAIDWQRGRGFFYSTRE
jgi:hypothetical protein